MTTIVWFTGLPASGKTTLARAVRDRLVASAVPSCLLDSDEIRSVLPEIGYDPAGRDQFYETVARLAALLANQELLVLVAATAPKREHRDRTRTRVERFVEVHVDTPLELCESRDPKALYRRARVGQITDLPGIGAAYEPPLAAEVVVSAAGEDVVQRIVELATAST